MDRSLQNRLASLKLNDVASQSHRKKIIPNVRQNSNEQPVVPRSYPVAGSCEPSFTKPLQNEKRTNANIPVYTNVEQSPIGGKMEIKNQGVTYSNIQVANKKPTTHIYSNVNTYSNLPPYSNDPEFDDFPPPPPEPVEYGQCTAAYPPLPEDLPPPPSPVSSSYSELRRATQYQHKNDPQDYGTYAPSSRTSSMYESIYEPINPRAPSETSSKSNYSLYGTTSSAPNRPSSSASRTHETEVDTLTDLLVNSMDSASVPDSDTFGECCKCEERIVGEGSGCTAMGKVYHITCFTCFHCDTQLQAKPFFILEGNPYCEEGYLETLEKCSVCVKPILDRILRATGRPYHPHCFTCVECGKSLDGITFTIDATNQIHCIDDFHKKFAPRCCVCKHPIMPEHGEEETVRIVALDRSFHINCYKCEDCGLVLSSEAEGRGCYPLDDHVFCKSCNAKRVQALSSVITTDL